MNTLATPPSVRRATAGDMPVVARLVEVFHQAHFGQVPYDPEHFLGYIGRNIDDPDLFVAILGKDAGLIMGCIVSTIFSPEPIAREILWYTSPQARGHGMELYRAFDNWAKGSRARSMLCALPWVEPKMEKLGFVMTEVGYFRLLPAPSVAVSPPETAVA